MFAVWRAFTPHKGTRRTIVSRSVNMVRQIHPRGSYVVPPLLSLELAKPENKVNH